MVSRKDPLQDLLNLQERINQLFDQSLGRGRDEEGARAPLSPAAWAPLADVCETPDGFVVLLELPGLERDDVELGIAGRIVTVKGERRLQGPTRPESFYRMERSYGTFSRTFRFAQEIDTARVIAEFREGLLKLELPKLAARRIRVERAG